MGFHCWKSGNWAVFVPRFYQKTVTPWCSCIPGALSNEHHPLCAQSDASISLTLVFLLSMRVPHCIYTLRKYIYEKNWLPWVNGLVSVLVEALSVYPLLHLLDPLCSDDQRSRKPPVTSLMILFGAVPVRSSRFLWSLSMALLFLSTSWVWAWEKDYSSLHRSRLELTCRWWDCVCPGNVI